MYLFYMYFDKNIHYCNQVLYWKKIVYYPLNVNFDFNLLYMYIYIYIYIYIGADRKLDESIKLIGC